MKVLIFSSSPNDDGLTAACASAAAEGVKIASGVKMAGGEVEVINLNQLKIGMCQACENGWGTCLEGHTCQTEDDFQELHARTLGAAAYVLVSPVYWGEMSESAKAFTDRLRRCEATRNEESGLYRKPVIAVAAAGGSGGGMITCLASMERWIEHVRARKFDLIPVNRWSREYKLVTIRAAAEAMLKELKGASG
jgi:multimeric flavodoxin WrbA